MHVLTHEVVSRMVEDTGRNWPSTFGEPRNSGYCAYRTGANFRSRCNNLVLAHHDLRHAVWYKLCPSVDLEGPTMKQDAHRREHLYGRLCRIRERVRDHHV